MKPPITGTDYARAAARLGCEPEAIEAVAAVESRGAGFNPDDSPKTLFEGHIFHRLTKGIFDSSYPTLSYPKWTLEHYGRTWQDEQYRLARAIELDKRAAMMSASWGKFQLMGFNHGACGFLSIEDFVAAMRESEVRHLEAFVGFIESNNLVDELQRKDFPGFARVFNGPGYAKNHYDTKMATAYVAARRAKGLE